MTGLTTTLNSEKLVSPSGLLTALCAEDKNEADFILQQVNSTVKHGRMIGARSFTGKAYDSHVVDTPGFAS